MYGISLTNHNFCSSLVEVKNDKDNSVHEGVPFPLPLSTENPFPLRSQTPATRAIKFEKRNVYFKSTFKIFHALIF